MNGQMKIYEVVISGGVATWPPPLPSVSNHCASNLSKLSVFLYPYDRFERSSEGREVDSLLGSDTPDNLNIKIPKKNSGEVLGWVMISSNFILTPERIYFPKFRHPCKKGISVNIMLTERCLFCLFMFVVRCLKARLSVY